MKDEINELDSKKPLVIFRLDDWQLGWLENIQRAVIEVFIEQQQKLCIGIIGKTLGSADIYSYGDRDNQSNHSYIQYTRDLLNNQPQLLEVYNHGWDAALSYQTASLKTQIEHIKKTNDVCQKHFGEKHKPTAFAPHENIFHPILTLQACQVNDIKVISGRLWEQPPDCDPEPVSALPLYVPTVSATSAYLIKHQTLGQTEGVPAEITLYQIENQISHYGFACCMLHPQEFANPDRTVNQRQIKELKKVIDELLNQELTIAWFGDLVNSSLDSLPWRTEPNLINN